MNHTPRVNLCAIYCIQTIARHCIARMKSTTLHPLIPHLGVGTPTTRSNTIHCSVVVFVAGCMIPVSVRDQCNLKTFSKYRRNHFDYNHTIQPFCFRCLKTGCRVSRCPLPIRSELIRLNEEAWILAPNFSQTSPIASKTHLCTYNQIDDLERSGVLLAEQFSDVENASELPCVPTHPSSHHQLFNDESFLCGPTTSATYMAAAVPHPAHYMMT